MAPSNEDKMYNLICKGEFADIKKTIKDRQETEEKHHQEMMNILRGKNGDPGLIDEVRANTRLRKALFWVLVTFCSGFLIQTAALIVIIVKDKLIHV